MTKITTTEELRVKITSYLQSNDRNGLYTDGDRAAEGQPPMTLDDAAEALVSSAEGNGSAGGDELDVMAWQVVPGTLAAAVVATILKRLKAAQDRERDPVSICFDGAIFRLLGDNRDCYLIDKDGRRAVGDVLEFAEARPVLACAALLEELVDELAGHGLTIIDKDGVPTIARTEPVAPGSVW